MGGRGGGVGDGFRVELGSREERRLCVVDEFY